MKSLVRLGGQLHKDQVEERVIWVYGHLGDKPVGRQTTGRQSNWATANWATHFGQLGDNIGRAIKDVNVGRLFEIINF